MYDPYRTLGDSGGPDTPFLYLLFLPPPHQPAASPRRQLRDGHVLARVAAVRFLCGTAPRAPVKSERSRSTELQDDLSDEMFPPRHPTPAGV
ncbi:Dystrophin [Manis pentadactyla]|nr:Dystrophin [Manis pentadactyla]